MTMTQPAYFLVIWILLVLLLLEAGILFFIIRHYQKKLRDQQERFAGYLQDLDDQNDSLKQKIANRSDKKLRPSKPKEFTL